jgi:uncharacterized membrane protein YvbJ
MHCTNCGTEIHEGSKFCPECGAPQAGLTRDQAAEQERAAQDDLTSSSQPEPKKRWKLPGWVVILGVGAIAVLVVCCV